MQNHPLTIPTALSRIATLSVFVVALGIFCPAALRADAAVNLSPSATMTRIVEQGDRPDFVLLDVRTPGEYAKGHIQGAKLLDYYHRDFLERLKALDRDKNYLLYCRTGNRSGRTLAVMAQLGFKQAAHLAGGIVAWQGKGYRLVKAEVVNPDLLAP